MKLGLIGAGKMGKALMKGAIRAGIVQAEDTWVLNRTASSTEALVHSDGVQAAKDLQQIAQECETILLCTKPFQVKEVLHELRQAGCAVDKHLIISVAAGVTLDALSQAIGGQARLIRAMPNTPSLIGQGATAYSVGPGATEADQLTAERLFGAVGVICQVNESLIDAVTGLSGSGPAYIYLVIEAMTDGGVRAGLPREIALELATQTVLGAASMVKETALHPAMLKDMVTSPGGTTIAGLQTLEEYKVRAAFIESILAAQARAKELGA